jgi:hypothetical protein
MQSGWLMLNLNPHPEKPQGAASGTPTRLNLQTGTPSNAEEKQDGKSKGHEETFEQSLPMTKDMRPAKEEKAENEESRKLQ